MTALIIVLVANVLAEVYPEYSHFASGSAMSFRRFTGTPKTAIVNYVSSFSNRFSSSRESGYLDCSAFSWDAVRACHGEIKAATATAKDQKVAMLKFANDYPSYFRKQIGKKREFSFEVSNVGLYDCENSIAPIKRITFSQSSNVIGPPYVFSIATVKGGDMALALTWQEGIVEPETAEKVLLKLKERTQNFTQEQ